MFNFVFELIIHKNLILKRVGWSRFQCIQKNDNLADIYEKGVCTYKLSMHIFACLKMSDP